jgi:NADH pyrophosphatase NudC (nudix superfamily)
MAIQRSNSSIENEEEEAEDAVFVNYNDVMQEINIDEEELPDDDGDDEDGNAGQAFGDCSPLAG